MSIETAQVGEPVECDKCGREWVSQEAHDLHLKLDHGIDPIDVKQKGGEE